MNAQWWSNISWSGPNRKSIPEHGLGSKRARCPLRESAKDVLNLPRPNHLVLMRIHKKNLLHTSKDKIVVWIVEKSWFCHYNRSVPERRILEWSPPSMRNSCQYTSLVHTFGVQFCGTATIHANFSCAVYDSWLWSPRFIFQHTQQ